jgi:serine/threonine-protein kinase
VKGKDAEAGHPPDSVETSRLHLDRNPEDQPSRLALARQLASQGEAAAARALLIALEDESGALARQATAQLAALDEEQGRFEAAAERWERLLAEDIDDPEPRARVLHLRRCLGGAAPPACNPVGVTQTLIQPEGVSLSRYEILREIGRGATSTVYLARDRTLGIELALKVFHPPARLSEACQRFFSEARLVAGLRHPGVVAIYDLDEAARTLVMEYLAADSLRDRLARTRPSALPCNETVALARSLLSTLAHVHGAGVVHGDLTPRNILYRGPGEPVLADFGSARLLGADSAGEPAAGTPIYLAPEQLRGAVSSPATDLFGVGAILWEALAGRPMRQFADLLAGRIERPPVARVPDSECPAHASLADLAAWLTESEPDKRPSSAGQALERLTRYSSGPSSSGSRSLGGASPG